MEKTNGIGKALESLRIPHFYRDLMTFMGGTGFILLACYVYPIQARGVLDKMGVKTVSAEIDILAFIVCYIVGRLLLILSMVLLGVYDTLLGMTLKVIRIRSVKVLWREARTKFQERIMKSGLPPSVSSAELKNTVTLGDIHFLRNNNLSMADEIERAGLNYLFMRLTVVTVFIAFWVINWKVIMPIFVVSFWFLLRSRNELNVIGVEVFRAAARDRFHNQDQVDV